MVAESARRFEALEAQAARILELFVRDGYERVAPAMLQPADVYLEAIGEELRARTYVFADPDGVELCLRPDLTVPTCRLYLERFPAADQRARYCYNGPAFRFHPGDGEAKRTREFRQAGIESFHAADREREEAAVVELVAEALRTSRMKGARLIIGDIGIIQAVLAAIAMPERWRQRLMRTFWRREQFELLLRRLTTEPGRGAAGLPADLLADVAALDTEAAQDRIATHLATERIPLIGARSLGEIAEHIRDIAADAAAHPLAGDAAQLIEDCISIRDTPRKVAKRLASIVKRSGIDLSEALERHERRLDLIEEAGVTLARAEFAADFGRGFAYYTGFVFQFEVPGLGRDGQIAGGGRYDGLARAVGAPVDVPAVGAAIHTERMLALVQGDLP
jgi:ATP phosphoribosyltransferase regulatory subunit